MAQETPASRLAAYAGGESWVDVWAPDSDGQNKDIFAVLEQMAELLAALNAARRWVRPGSPDREIVEAVITKAQGG